MNNSTTILVQIYYQKPQRFFVIYGHVTLSKITTNYITSVFQLPVSAKTQKGASNWHDEPSFLVEFSTKDFSAPSARKNACFKGENVANYCKQFSLRHRNSTDKSLQHLASLSRPFQSCIHALKSAQCKRAKQFVQVLFAFSSGWCQKFFSGVISMSLSIC